MNGVWYLISFWDKQNSLKNLDLAFYKFLFYRKIHFQKKEPIRILVPKWPNFQLFNKNFRGRNKNKWLECKMCLEKGLTQKPIFLQRKKNLSFRLNFAIWILVQNSFITVSLQKLNFWPFRLSHILVCKLQSRLKKVLDKIIFKRFRIKFIKIG